MIERNNQCFFSKTDSNYSAWIVSPSQFGWVTHKICLGCCRTFYKL